MVSITFTLELIGSNRGNQNVNQQLQNLLQNSNPATTQALLAAIQQQPRSGGKINNIKIIRTKYFFRKKLG